MEVYLGFRNQEARGRKQDWSGPSGTAGGVKVKVKVKIKIFSTSA